MAVTLTELVARFGGELVGDGTRMMRQVAPLERATSDEIGFVSQSKYLAQLASHPRGRSDFARWTRVTPPDLPRILTPNPYLYFARVSALLNPPPRPPVGIHPAATVAADAQHCRRCLHRCRCRDRLPARVIGARTVIGANSVVGERRGDRRRLSAARQRHRLSPL